jgi:hypothetical protein
MTMQQAIMQIESTGGMARQPARSTALAVWVHKAVPAAFDRAVARIKAAGFTVIVCKSREMFDGR